MHCRHGFGGNHDRCHEVEAHCAQASRAALVMLAPGTSLSRRSSKYAFFRPPGPCPASRWRTGPTSCQQRTGGRRGQDLPGGALLGAQRSTTASQGRRGHRPRCAVLRPRPLPADLRRVAAGRFPTATVAAERCGSSPEFQPKEFEDYKVIAMSTASPATSRRAPRSVAGRPEGREAACRRYRCRCSRRWARRRSACRCRKSQSLRPRS